MMILALVATMTATAQNLTVSGTLKGLADGTPLELRILSHDDDPAIATATLQNGQFQIKATLSEPVIVGIRPDGNYSGLRMMAAPGDAITVNATLQERDNGNNIYYEAGDLQISGKRENVLVLRPNAEGNLTAYNVDMTSFDAVHNSPAYYIHQNDYIYVEPNRKRANESTVNANTVTSASFWISFVSFLASMATTVSVLMLKN